MQTTPTSSVLVLLKQGEEFIGAKTQEFADKAAYNVALWLLVNQYVSDGFYVWPLAINSNGAKTLNTKFNPLQAPLEGSLETLVCRYFSNTFADPISQMSDNLWPTLEALPAALIKVGCDLKRSNSILFRFKHNCFVHFNTRTNQYQPLQIGTRFYNSLLQNAHFCREFDNIPWNVESWSDGNLLSILPNCKLSLYLVSAGNSPRTMVFFYALLGRMLHKPRLHDKWNEILAIHSDSGTESNLVYIVKLLFDSFDISNFSANQQTPTAEERPPQLAILHVPRRQRRQRRVNLTRVIWPNSHHLIYGDIYSLDSSMNQLMVRDHPKADASYIELREELPIIIQLANYFYFFAVKKLGFRDSLSDWADLWQKPCTHCHSYELCRHLFVLK